MVILEEKVDTQVNTTLEDIAQIENTKIFNNKYFGYIKNTIIWQII